MGRGLTARLTGEKLPQGQKMCGAGRGGWRDCTEAIYCRVVRSTVNVAKTNLFLVIKIDRRPNETQRILLLLKARVLSTILIMFMTIAVA